MPTMMLLVVEDHAPSRSALAQGLEMKGFTVISVSSAEEALMLLDDFRFDLVVSDIGLPDMDGWQLMQNIRKALPSQRCLALSAYGSLDDVEKSRQAGFLGHLVKPISLDSLEAKIRELLESSAERGPG